MKRTELIDEKLIYLAEFCKKAIQDEFRNCDENTKRHMTKKRASTAFETSINEDIRKKTRTNQIDNKKLDQQTEKKTTELTHCKHELKANKCLNYNCTFIHVDKNRIKCKKGYECEYLYNDSEKALKHKLEFIHPRKPVKKICNFGLKCYNTSCKFFHEEAIDGKNNACPLGSHCVDQFPMHDMLYFILDSEPKRKCFKTHPSCKTTLTFCDECNRICTVSQFNDKTCPFNLRKL
jgi:hypothetical protein